MILIIIISIKFIDLEYGKVWLFFGCRQRNLDLYRQEKEEMVELGVLNKIFLALSREPGFKKVINSKCFLNNLYHFVILEILLYINIYI